MKKYLYTFPRANAKSHGKVEIDIRGCVNGETPLEDFGDYLLTDTEITPEAAFEKWLSYID